METILQFGAGKFLRAFADYFIHQANLGGQEVGRIVVVQSTGGDRADLLNRQGCKYHVVLRGRVAGQVVDTVEEVASVSRSLVASQSWPEVLELARRPELRFVLSNATEAGYELSSDDRPDSAPPKSFPAKLLQVLRSRFDAGLPGLTVLPCELFEHNADRLRQVALEQCERWGWTDPAWRTWLLDGNGWRNTLVDRIVVGTPADHPLLASDPLLLFAEPYGLWAVEHPVAGGPPEQLFDHPCLLKTPDVTPYHLRKVRILNGSHTALVCKALPAGFVTVRQAVEDPEMGEWLRGLMFEEIVPVVARQAADAEAFATAVLDRFLNPFLEHKLADIALHHDAKVRLRLVPTLQQHREFFGTTPPRLAEILAPLGLA